MTAKVGALAFAFTLLDGIVSAMATGTFFFVMKLLIFTGVYGVYAYVTCMNDEERTLVRGFLRKCYERN